MEPIAKTVVVALLICRAILGPAPDAQAQGTTNLEKAKLWVEDYEHLTIFVENVGTEAEDLGLTRDRIQTETELRLRQAGISPSDAFVIDGFELPLPSLDVVVGKDVVDYHLNVQIRVVGTYFRVAVAFKRFASYALPDGEFARGYMTSWERTSSGAFDEGDGDYVIGSLDQVLDTFLDEYLKANQ